MELSVDNLIETSCLRHSILFFLCLNGVLRMVLNPRLSGPTTPAAPQMPNRSPRFRLHTVSDERPHQQTVSPLAHPITQAALPAAAPATNRPAGHTTHTTFTSAMAALACQVTTTSWIPIQTTHRHSGWYAWR